MLILVRHGRTALNAAGLLQGRIDAPLDDVGEEQARLVAGSLPTPARIISSPLQRAVQTASAFGVPIEIDPRFIELDYGDIDGTPVADIEPSTWTTWQGDLDFVPAGGESIAALGERVRDGLEAIRDECVSSNVVVVSHVSPIKAAVAWALGVDDGVAWRMHLATASTTTIGFRGTRPVMHSFNDIGHLG
jgi:alpha-ribazole phosphatase